MADKKREYIKETFKIIQEEGIENITIRRLATNIGCNSSALYKHFDNLEHLITLASIQFLKPYIIEFQNASESRIHNPLEFNMKMWKAFIHESFKNISVFEYLFFGKYSDKLSDTMYEYFQLFPEDMFQMDGYTASIMLNGSLEERDLILLRTAATQNLIDFDDAKTLSTVYSMVYHGFLLKYKPYYKDAAIMRKAEKECFDTIKAVLQKFKK